MNYNIYNSIFEFLNNNKKTMIIYLFLSILAPVGKIALPHYYGKIIEEISNNKKITEQVKNTILIILGVWFFVQIISGITSWLDSYFIPALQEYLRKTLIEGIINRYKEDFKEQETGILLTQIIKLPYIVRNLIDDIRLQLLPTFFILMLSIGYFFYVDKNIGLISLFAIIFYFTILFIFSNKCNNESMLMNIEYEKLHENIDDTLGNLLNVYTSSGINEEMNRIMAQNDIYRQKSIQTLKCSLKFRIVSSLIYLVIFFGINGYGLYKFSNNELEVDSIVSLLIISSFIISEMGHLSDDVEDVIYSTSTIQQIQKGIDIKENIRSNKNKNKNLKQINNQIEISGLKLKLGDKYILNNIDLIIKPNEKVGIIGMIGSGKSSLVRCILRLYKYEGIIKVGSHNIQDLDLNEYRKNIIFIPQQPRLFNRTIYENISYGNNASREYVKKLMDRYDLKLPLDYQVGKYGEKISGGQRQIVYLLRCMCKNAKIIIMDEPSTSLDKATKEYVFTILRDMFKNKTVIIVTHDKELLKFVDRTINMYLGRIK